MADVTALELERAERLIKVLFETGEWPTHALEHFDIETEGFSKFIKHQVGTLRAMYSDIPPTHEAAIATMFTHLFLAGFSAGRGVGYSGDSGLNT
jgi:hypothetical protein